MNTKALRASHAKDQASPLEAHRLFLTQLVMQGGPEPADYPAFNAWLDQLANEVRSGNLNVDDVRAIWATAAAVTFCESTMQGFCRLKPHGYAGDFEVIDRIYQEWISSDPALAKWDHYFHALAAPRAVRNRKAYLHAWLREAERHRSDDPLRLLNVGSGPGRDVCEYFQCAPDTRVICECVDRDPQAIAYASTLCAAFRGRVTFHEANALRFRPAQAPHLIWSAGLFDYLEPRLFVVLLRRLWRGLAPGGELAVGNFSPANSTRTHMELVGEWVLFHRDEIELTSLALQAGVPDHAIRIGCEPEGVNLFLHLMKPSE